jgi:hypothetical protein
MAVVYQHRRLDNNTVFYVGIGKSISRAYSKSGRTNYWRNIVNKVGYSVTVLIGEISMEEAWRLEMELISYYGRFHLGEGLLVNMTEGGELGYNRLGTWLGKKLSPEHKEKLRLAKLGKKRPKHSEETKAKMSKSHKGKILSETTKEKIRIVNIGKKLSEETKDKLRKPKKTCNTLINKLL